MIATIDHPPVYDPVTVPVDRDALARLRVAVWDVELIRGHDSVPRAKRAHEELLAAARSLLGGTP
jgi:hypothetical protein